MKKSILINSPHIPSSIQFSNNHSHLYKKKKNTRGASLQHRHLALEAARDHRQPIRSQEMVGATGEKKCSFTESHSLTENLKLPFEKGTDLAALG